MSELPPSLLNGPALPPPDGVKPNFDNPSNDDTLAWTVSIVTLVFSLAAVCMRIYTKTQILRKMEIEDCKLIARVLTA
jgi:hypothetical protein